MHSKGGWLGPAKLQRRILLPFFKNQHFKVVENPKEENRRGGVISQMLPSSEKIIQSCFLVTLGLGFDDLLNKWKNGN